MSSAIVIPTAKGLYLCDFVIGSPGGKTDIYNLFDTITAPVGYPHVQARFCVFAQLAGGQGRVPCFFDIRDAASGRLLRSTTTQHLNFPTRHTIRQMVVCILGCPFPQPGVYLIELFCDNQWVADVPLRLR